VSFFKFFSPSRTAINFLPLFRPLFSQKLSRPSKRPSNSLYFVFFPTFCAHSTTFVFLRPGFFRSLLFTAWWGSSPPLAPTPRRRGNAADGLVLCNRQTTILRGPGFLSVLPAFSISFRFAANCSPFLVNQVLKSPPPPSPSFPFPFASAENRFRDAPAPPPPSLFSPHFPWKDGCIGKLSFSPSPLPNTPPPLNFGQALSHPGLIF